MLQAARAKRKVWPAPSFFARRPLMNIALALCAGTALSTRVPYGIWSWGALLVCVAACALLYRHGRSGFVLLLCAAGLLGMIRGAMEFQPPPLPDTGRWMVEGTIQGSVRRNDKAMMYTLADVRVRQPGEEAWTRVASNLYVYDPAVENVNLAHGQRVSVRGTGYLPSGARNPGGFDQRMWLAQSGSHMRLYASGAARVIAPAEWSIYGAVLSINASLGAQIDVLFGEASSVVRAMLLGDRADRADEWYRWMQDSGIVHVLSVSGLHVGLWYMLLDQFLKRLPASPRTRWLLLAILLSLYILITGLRDSALRAGVMLLAVQGGRVARRKADPLTSLALAAALILLLRPLDIFSAGFQMSFCAVLGIALLGVPLRRALEWMPEAAKGGLSVTMSAQLGVLPVSAFWFGKISVISLISNLPVIPLAGLLIPVSAMALALHALWPPLGYLLVESAKGLVLLLLLIAKAAARVPFATARVGAFAWYFAAAYFACMLLCSTAVVWRWRARLLCMGALCCLAVGVGALTSYHGVYYVQLDVGQALSGVLHTGRKTYVYDCGNENSDLTEYLLYTGSGVEGLFLSHPHADHVGGLIELLEAGIPVRTVYVPANAVCYGADELYRNLMANVEAHGIPIVEVAAGDVLDLDGLRATVIAPRRDPAGKGDANARSIVLRVKIGDYALLLCGDADVIGSSDVACDVLQVAHHGSRNATDQAFLHSAMPGVALISAGRNNVYGHPHPETLARLESVGADVFQTQEAGALTLYFEDSIRVEAFCR